MAAESVPFTRTRRFRIGAGIAILAAIGAIGWYIATRGRESTDDAQLDARLTQIAPRVGGTVLRLAVDDNEQVEAGAVLLELDPRDFQVAVDKARAELADAEASAVAAENAVPVTAATAAGNVTGARGGIAESLGAVTGAERELDAAKARVAAAQARVREADANAAKAAKDVERLRGLVAKDEVSQQQFDTAVATAEVQKAAAESARSQVTEAAAGIRVAESRLTQARAGEQQARAQLTTAETGPAQIAATKARAQSARARVQQARATLSQAELNLQYTTIKAPARGIISKKGVNVGQVVQAGQPLMALVQTDDVWVTANFKETQLRDIRPGQRATIEVDAMGGRTFTGKVDSIAGATGARFSVLPPENATGNFVKVVQRIPVKIVLDPGQDPERRLRPGMSVMPTIYTR